MIELRLLFFLPHIGNVYCRFIYINTTVSTPTADRGMSPVTQCRSASRRIRPLADGDVNHEFSTPSPDDNDYSLGFRSRK